MTWERNKKKVAWGDRIINWGDMTRVAEAVRSGAAEAPDMLCGGTPCFPAGTLVSTASGLVPIEDVRPGDMVLTHAGRFRKVLRFGSKHDALTIGLKGQGHHLLTTTPEHPFYSALRRSRSTRTNGRPVRETWVEGPEWTEAQAMPGRHWATPTTHPRLPIPLPVIFGRESVCPDVTDDLLWLAGAYAGDGWTRMTPRRSYTLFGVNVDKAALIMERADRLGLTVTQSETRTGIRLQFAGGALSRWMRANFGHGCDGKTVPVWLLGAPENFRRAFFDGYAAMDGTPSPAGGTTVATVCWSLAVGFKMLAATLGRAASVRSVRSSRQVCTIEGREVSERPYFQVTANPASRSSFEKDGMRYGLVRGIVPTAPTTVYNLEVEEDNSYLVDGIVVHNCQAFSVAGSRKGLADPRGGLTLAFVTLADTIDEVRRENGQSPCVVYWENVFGVLTSKDNAFGCFLAALAGEDVPVEPPGGRWTNAGVVLGPERAVGWRVGDAQYFGVAQRRCRVYVVASARDGFDPARVLFESEGVRRDTAPSREAGDALTGALDASLGGCDENDAIGRRLVCVSSGRAGERSELPSLAGRPVGSGRDVRLAAFGGGNTEGELSVATTTTTTKTRIDFDAETFVVHGTQDPIVSDKAHPLACNSGRENAVLSVALRGRQGGGTAELGDNLANCLRSSGGGGDKPYVLVFDPTQVTSPQNRSNPRPGDSGTGLPAAGHAPTICISGEVTHTLKAEGFDASEDGTGRGQPIVAVSSRVRRLMPIECERLQGFPTGWTDVPWGKGRASDGARYKQLGNSWAVPHAAWVCRRLTEHLIELDAAVTEPIFDELTAWTLAA